MQRTGVCPYCRGQGCNRCLRGRVVCPYCKGHGCDRCSRIRGDKRVSCNCNKQRYWFLIMIILVLLGYIFFTRV